MATEKTLTGINFFICSTYVDLKAHREAVINAIRGQAGVINAQEFFGARDQKPIATCLEEVDKSTVFVLFVAHRYGSVELSSNKSFVELEFERAQGRDDMLKLAYIIDPSHPWPPNQISRDEDAKKLDLFKARIENEFTVSYFTSPESLAKKVSEDLLRELPKKGIKLGVATGTSAARTPLQILGDFTTLPKLHHGEQFRIKVKLGKPERADKNACEAFSYTYGSALRRSFEPMDNTLTNFSSHGLAIYAPSGTAEEFMAIPKGAEVEVEVQTIQGDYLSKTPVFGPQKEYGYSQARMQDYLGYTRVVVDHEVERHLLLGLEFISAT